MSIMHKTKKFSFFVLILSFFANTQVLHAHQEPTSPFQHIGALHLPSFTHDVLPTKQTEQKPKKISLIARLNNLDEDFDFEIQQPSNIKKFELIYSNLFSSAHYQLPAITCQQQLDDLEVFCGKHEKSSTLLNSIKRTATSFGEAFLAYMISAPTSDTTILKNRQTAITWLRSNDKETAELTKHLDTIKDSEAQIFALWQEQNKANKLFLNDIYFTSNAPLISSLKALNTSTVYQEFSTHGRRIFAHLIPLALSYFAGKSALKGTLKQNCLTAANFYNSLNPHLKPIFNIYGTLYLGIIGFAQYINTQGELTKYNLCKCLHAQTTSISHFVKATKYAHALVKKHPELAAFTCCAQLEEVLKTKDNATQIKLKKLFTMLDTNTFNGKANVFTLIGRVRAAYALLQEVKNDITPLMVAIGEIDAYLSCAKLYTEFENTRTPYVFARYLENQDMPLVHMHNMWNPLITPDKAVVNSINLGADLPQNIILTGPNAGGKSTFLKGTLLSLWLAQTIGIAPAQLEFTPFELFNTYMNISDDTAGGNSLFKSEVLRAQQLSQNIKALKPGQFSISIMDEMFSGTSPKEGEAATHAVANNISQEKNSILLLATHFPLLKEFETKTGLFKNYQVRVIEHEDSTLSYPFKLETGAADQNVAIKILQLQGFDSSIINDAHAILNR